MLPRLQAEERLNAISDRSIAFGSVERREQEAALSALRKEAGMRSTKPKKANSAVLAAMGISVVGPRPSADAKRVSGNG